MTVKRLGDFTLQELKTMCKYTNCTMCQFFDTTDRICSLANIIPNPYNLPLDIIAKNEEMNTECEGNGRKLGDLSVRDIYNICRTHSCDCCPLVEDKKGMRCHIYNTVPSVFSLKAVITEGKPIGGDIITKVVQEVLPDISYDKAKAVSKHVMEAIKGTAVRGD